MVEILSNASDAIVILGALGGAYAVYRKVRPEVDKLSAESTLLHVTAQAKIIDDLQSEVDRQQRQIVRMKQEHTAEKKEMRKELDSLQQLNVGLQRRMLVLEEKLQEARA